MKHILSLDPYVEISEGGLKYLVAEYKWILADRPDDMTDDLDPLWYAMSDEDMRFMNSRGNMVTDWSNPIWANGNGFQFSMLKPYL